MNKKYIAEFIGTFALSFVVYMAIASGASLPLAIPVIAGLTLGLFVYSIGHISGCHINPAVTIGLWSIKKISAKDAVTYIIVQALGALLAMFVGSSFFQLNSLLGTSGFSSMIFLAEMLGTFFFTFGIASVVSGKVNTTMSGVVVGGSLLLGVIIASLAGSLGILNPAVAYALGSLSWTYCLAPIVGSIIGFNVYEKLV